MYAIGFLLILNLIWLISFNSNYLLHKGTWKFRFAFTLEEQIAPTNFFMAGGTFFTLSGLSMQYRYYIWKRLCWLNNK